MDFKQELITTLHDIDVGGDTDRLKQAVSEMSHDRPNKLILPILYSEVESTTLPVIRDSLNKCDYINEVIVALSAKDEREYANALRFFKRLERPNLVVWCNGPRINEVLSELKDRELDVTEVSGKGKDVWVALGIASLDAYAIAMHDADIVGYKNDLAAKLLFPVVSDELDFFFNKGYYARIGSATMYGRVFRLFVCPFLDALMKICSSNLFEYLKSFRYSLSGEVAMTSDMALNIRLGGDWGLELSMLTEVYRNTALKRICQTDLGYYEHKHQDVGIGDPYSGLIKMARDLTRTMLCNLNEIEGVMVDKSFMLSLKVLYKRIAQDTVRQYQADALFNGLAYNRHVEETTVEYFADVLMGASMEYVVNPTATQLPDWLRAMSAMPKLRRRLKEAAEKEAESVKV